MIRVSSRTAIVAFEFRDANRHMEEAFIRDVLKYRYGAVRMLANVYTFELQKNAVDKIIELISYTETYISPSTDTVNIWYHMETDGKLRVYHTMLGKRVLNEGETDSFF